MRGVILAVLVLAGVPQTLVPPEPRAQRVFGAGGQLPAPDPNAPPIVDIALRMVRAAGGGSSIARSGVRGDASSSVYAGLGPCIVGASAEDPAHENSLSWHASGRVRSVDRGMAVADVEWQRLEYRPAGVVAGPRVRTTLTLPLGERVAVDFVEAAGSTCRMDGLIFEIGVAPDHGFRLAMSGEGRSITGVAAGGRAGGGGGTGRPITAEAQAERQRQGAEAARAASVVTRPMPPRQYQVDAWLVPDTAVSSSSPASPALAQRLSQVIGGTGGRFAFPPIASEPAANSSGVVDISALVIPVGGDQLIVAITRQATPTNGASPASAGWIKAVPLPKSSDVLSFEIPGYGLRVKIGHQ